MSFLRRLTLSQIASDLRFAIRITNRSRSQIARFGALSPAGRGQEGLGNLFPFFGDFGPGGSGPKGPKNPFNRVHAQGVVLCERACFCLLSAF